MSRGKFLKNGVAPKKEDVNNDRKPICSNIQKLRNVLIRHGLLKPQHEAIQPQTWRERLTFVAENSKDDKDAPSYLFGYLRCYIVFDKDSDAFYNWLMLVSLAVMYNFIFVIGRACFWEMANLMPVGWLGGDYKSWPCSTSIILT